MVNMRTFDLVVLGGGPAGVAGARWAALLGGRVALVEREHDLGGAGINTGTVPSKTLRETALAVTGLRSRRLLGLDVALRTETHMHDLTAARERVSESARHRAAVNL